MNILCILIDTLRADHLGCYGYTKPTSPHIDRIASQGVLFERAFAPGIPTQPSHATLYTGRHPIVHNIVTHGGDADLSDELPVLPETLQRAGYTTCAVDNLYDMKRWFARGYEFYINPGQRHRMGLMVSCEEINRRAASWLKAHAQEPFFLFVHYWDPHTPYIPPSAYRDLFYEGHDPYDPTNCSLDALDRQPLGRCWRETWFPKLGGPVTDAEYVIAMYDGEIRYVDEAVGALMITLEEIGMTEDTLVVITSDHGESLLEHDILFEHHGLYDCTIRVPLILRWPAGGWVDGRRVHEMVQLVDIAPTLIDVVGEKPSRGIEGRSLRPLLEGWTDDPPHKVVIAEECTWQAKWALRTDRHKFILSREPDLHGMPMRELYDLQMDPEETQNWIEQQPRLAAEMEAALEEWIQSMLVRHGLNDDPLRVQGITLGRRWREQQAA